MLTRRASIAMAPAFLALTPTLGAVAAALKIIGFRYVAMFNFKGGVPDDEQQRFAKRLREEANVMPAVTSATAGQTGMKLGEHSRFAWAVVLDFADPTAFRTYRDSDALTLAKLSSMLDGYTISQAGNFFQSSAPDPERAARNIWSRHIIFFNFKDKVALEKRASVIADMKVAIGENPFCLNFMVGKNILPRSATSQYEWVCTVDFASLDDRNAYGKDAIHRAHTETQFLPNCDYTSLNFEP